MARGLTRDQAKMGGSVTSIHTNDASSERDALSRSVAVTTTAAAVFAVFAVLAVGCKPKEGGACGAGSSVCTGSDSSLFCENGHFVRMNCRGPGGCTATGQSISCDQIIGSIGEHCQGTGAACSAEGVLELRCVDGTMQLANACRGPLHCHTASHMVMCDRSVVALGDACETEDAWACTEDYSTALECHDSTFRVHSPCRGPERCHVADGTVSCDKTVAMVGDPCAGETAACSVDGSAFLRCESGSYSQVAVCRGPAHCSSVGGHVRCDESLGMAGDACASGSSCSTDGTQWLQCEEGHLVVHATCSGGCVVADERIRCTGVHR